MQDLKRDMWTALICGDFEIPPKPWIAFRSGGGKDVLAGSAAGSWERKNAPLVSNTVNK